MSGGKDANRQLEHIKSERKRILSRRELLERRAQELKRRKAELQESSQELVPVVSDIEERPLSDKEKTALKTALFSMERWMDSLDKSRSTLEQVGDKVGKSVNTVSAVMAVMETLRSFQDAKTAPVTAMNIDDSDPDVKFLRVAKSLLEVIRNPSVRQLIGETTRAMRARKENPASDATEV